MSQTKHSLECIKLRYTLQLFGPEGPSSGYNTVLEHTETSNAGGYLYIQGMIVSRHKCTSLAYVRWTLCSGVRTLNAKIESVTRLSSSRRAPEFLM